MESFPKNNKYEPYGADKDPEDSHINSTPRVAFSDIIESLSDDDRELVVENETLFKEIDAAVDGDERRRIANQSATDFETGQKLVRIVERLQHRYRSNT